MLSEISEKIDRNRDAIIQTAADMIMIPSRNPPGEEKKCAEYIYSKLKELGYEAHLVKEPYVDRPQVVGILRSGDSDDTVLLNGHIDTVPEGDPASWHFDPFSGKVEDGFLHGRGSVDMKSALSIMMHSPKIVEARCNVLLLFAVGEERAEPGTSHLLSWSKKLGLKMRYGLVLEPTGLNVATAQNGALWLKATIKGKATHASTPAEGINAIEKSFDVISTIHRYKTKIEQESHEMYGRPSCEITMINGGIKENVLPDSCSIVIDRRLTPDEDVEKVEREIVSMLKTTPAEITIDTITSRPSVAIGIDSVIVRSLLEILDEMKISGKTMCFAGATDNEYLVSDKIEGVVWGPGELKLAHAVDERISINEVKNCATALALLLQKSSFQ